MYRSYEYNLCQKIQPNLIKPLFLYLKQQPGFFINTQNLD
jgi:hypothetical protein